MKAISWIFRKLTQNEFKAITDQIQSEGGGSQTYIDLPKGKIPDEFLNDFFGEGTRLGENKGYKWSIDIYSLGLNMPPQQTIISQRRESSNCIREQNKDKRVNIWKSEFSDFPSTHYDENTNPIYVFVLKTFDGNFYAGWFYSNAYKEDWFVTKDLCKPFFGESAGYGIFNTAIDVVVDNYHWPFKQLSNKIENQSAESLSEVFKDSFVGRVITAIRTKPFVLLAGISGTGKSRIVRQLAKACWDTTTEEGRKEAESHKPSNFEMVQVKPNWHDSSELLGYVSRIGDKPEFIAGDFLKFIAKAWENPDIPYFLCLDEMNLAPVEQYFAEYLSVVESRKLIDDCETIKTDPILKKESEEWYLHLVNTITTEALDPKVKEDFLTEGIRIPQNLIVIGTVNMDETTYSFSRKVLDRAMTIEMNDVELNGGLDKSKSNLPHIKPEQLLADSVEGYDVYSDEFKADCDTVIEYLGAVNDILTNTSFRIAYRTRNEFLIYVVNSIRLAPKEDMADSEKRNKVIADALDEVTSMKILSRIEGDKRKVHFLCRLKDTLKAKLDSIDKGDRSEENSVSLGKLKTMTDRLDSGYTSFWD